MIKKRGQVTIFIIIAIIIVAIVALLYIFKDSIFGGDVPQSLEPVYTTFMTCLEEDLQTGIDVLESQAGYIELPEFEPGSTYMPFSSQLDFLGNPIPYWYYVSGNNIQKEQIPSKEDMENELEKFIEEQIKDCYFGDYYEQEFEITQREPKAEITIRDNQVEIILYMNLIITKGEDTVLINEHEIVVDSRLGSLYDSARKIYEHEQKTLFLEEYGVDIMRLYAPVDGVEMTCSPLVWNAEEVFDDLQEAIEANTMALKVKGDKNDYFLVHVDVDEDVRFLNSRNWASGFEVSPSEGGVLIAEPIGNQPGLGILGFCYVPYHFVYNIRYPVLVQVYSGTEIFQFPLAVVIQGNMPREAMKGTAVEIEDTGMCENKNTFIEVNTYDKDLRPVKADIAFECAGARCEIGTAEFGTLEEMFPQCVNGFIKATAEGFEEANYIVTTVRPDRINIILDKLYELHVDLKLNRRDFNGEAIISFIGEKSSRTIFYPEQYKVELSEGQYEVQVYIYKNSSLKIAATNIEQCVDVPKGGLGGLFGLTEEKCFDIEMPEQIISNALAGGGRQNYYILESELENAKEVEINADSLPVPRSIEQLQDNYIFFEEKGLDIYFR